MNLIEQLAAINPRWRQEVASDPIDAAIELGLLEPEAVEERPKPLDFHDERANWERLCAAEEDE